MSSAADEEAIRDLHVSNALMGDRAALQAAWDQDGYWFFQGVLDQSAVAALRDDCLRALSQLCDVRADDPLATWNGGDPDKVPRRVDPLDETPWINLVNHPTARDLFRFLLNDDPFWVPIMGYVTLPPAADRTKERYFFVHQDGFYNEGIPCVTCWLPLVEISKSMGGLAVAEGMHKGPYLNDLSNPPFYPVPAGSVPPQSWRRSSYSPGDIVIFDRRTPHSGVTNHSDRCRLSLDMRVMPASGHVPSIGELVESGPDYILIRTREGQQQRFTVDERTYCRDVRANRISVEKFVANLKSHEQVIVADDEHGRALVIRPRRG